MSRAAVGAAALALAALTSACLGYQRELTRETSAYGAPTAAQAVRSFLEAARAEDYPRMGQLFGTRQGPAESRLGVTHVEKRMVVLAGLLEHESHTVRPSGLTQPEPHRRRFSVSLTGTREGDVTVPVFAVRSEGGRWFVERIETDPLTADSP